MFNAGSYDITITETADFLEDSVKFFTPAEKNSLADFIAKYPDVGDMIPDCAGVRVVSWKAASQGKDGRVWVVYYFRDLNVPVYLLSVLPKTEKIEMNQEEKTMLANYANEIVYLSVANRFRIFSRA